MAFMHEGLASGGWERLSLAEQLGNVGSEVLRASRSEGKDEKSFWTAVERALELFDLTLQDPRWKGRRREIGRARAVYGGKLYKSSLPDLVRYFDVFALAAQSKR